MGGLEDRGPGGGRRGSGDDVAVGGFDNLPLAEYVTPSLTTIRQPIFEIGKELTNMLVGIIAGQLPQNLASLIQPELIIRESSGKLQFQDKE